MEHRDGIVGAGGVGDGDQWVQLPLGFKIGKVQKVARQPMRFALNLQWNFVEVAGVNKAKVVFTVTEGPDARIGEPSMITFHLGVMSLWSVLRFN